MMPHDIEDMFKSSNLTLFPSKREIQTDCSCPDIAKPSQKHGANQPAFYRKQVAYSEQGLVDPLIVYSSVSIVVSLSICMFLIHKLGALRFTCER